MTRCTVVLVYVYVCTGLEPLVVEKRNPSALACLVFHGHSLAELWYVALIWQYFPPPPPDVFMGAH